MRFALIAAIAVFGIFFCGPVLSLTAMAAECGPSVLLEGDSDLVDPIKRILEDRSIELNPQKECTPVIATVSRVEQGILVYIQDPFGRTCERNADDVSAAATIIESWARGDISRTLMTPTELEGKKPEPAQPKETFPKISFDKRRGNIFISADVYGASDGSIWYGGGFGGCGNVGYVCLGLMARALKDPGSNRYYDEYKLDRHGVDAMALIDIPLKFGNVSFKPGIALGAGWLRSHGLGKSTEGAQNDSTGQADGFNIGTEGAIEKHDTVPARYHWMTFDSWGPRLDAHLTVGFELGSGIDLAFGLTYRFSFLAHSDDFEQDGYRIPGEPWGNLFGVKMIIGYWLE